jgi:YaiO family outer membrane protein
LRQLEASARAWTASVSYVHDRFSDGRGAWHEQAISLARATPIGSIAVRGTRAASFSLTDEQLEVELYPTFRAGTYAFVGVGVAPDAALYPHHRVAVDLHQTLGRGLEVSAGYRRLAFAEITHVYLVTLTRYVGTWMTTGKVYYVPARGTLDSTASYYGLVRRYFGADGTSFIGFAYGHGLSREEVRGVGDLITVSGDTLRGQIDVAVTARWRLRLDTSTSRQKQSWGTVWQTAVDTGLALRF